ncbi:hypothetical protein PREVCOP_06401 [Segatella copri DSM 18205]|uniref:Uncharacterized protein n=1 Tax=Segatella copri DSM 18205 TaxID=537011 RepID=D1PGN6_9BACT|nr:hypothetical protein PREVCOP_06401 [Segatella copri DSM 18205]
MVLHTIFPSHYVRFFFFLSSFPCFFFLFSKIANRVFAVFDNIFSSFFLILRPKISTL